MTRINKLDFQDELQVLAGYVCDEKLEMLLSAGVGRNSNDGGNVHGLADVSTSSEVQACSGRHLQEGSGRRHAYIAADKTVREAVSCDLDANADGIKVPGRDIFILNTGFLCELVLKNK